MKKRIILLLTCISMLMTVIPFNTNTQASVDTRSNMPGTDEFNIISYDSYLAQFSGNGMAQTPIDIQAISYKNNQGAEVTVGEIDGKKDVLIWNGEQGLLSWEINVPNDGYYNVELEYYQLPGHGNSIELELLVNNEHPYKEAKNFFLRRIWKNKGEIRADSRGNEISPEHEEAPEWRKEYFVDSEGYYDGPLKIFLKAGKNILSVGCLREPFALAAITLKEKPQPITYEEYKKQNAGKKDDAAGSEPIIVQAEKADKKTDMMLHTTYDKSNAGTQPNHPSLVRQNTIGGMTWSQNGQMLTWKINVDKAGYYKLGFKARQNLLRGMFVTRALTIDGETVFKESEKLEFKYDLNWYMYTVGGKDNPYMFYFEPGEYEIVLEVELGSFGEIVKVVQDSMYELNDQYRKILMISGTAPDKYRDYMLEKQIPGLIESFQANEDTLRAQAKEIETRYKSRGSEAALLYRIADQLKSFISKPDTIPMRLVSFSGNISALSAWVISIKEQPLELDFLALTPYESKMPKVKAGMWDNLVFGTKAFIASFLVDYDLGGTGQKSDSIDVWINLDVLANNTSVGGITAGGNTSGGRDQAQLIKLLIDERFTPEKDIKVNLGMVQDALVKASLAGKGPDVALMAANDLPVNMAMRGSVVPLSDFPDFPEVESRFFESGIMPYKYKGKVYALPEIQNFDMMFYRKDILSDLGFEAPKTWDELFVILPVIQRNNMNFGLGSSNVTFETLLFQNGMSMYNEDLTKSSLDDPKAIETFKFWTDLYTKYSIPQEYNFYSRFRTGEVPIGMGSYFYYNMFSVAAPEIQGLWEMVPIPGTPDGNGNIDTSEVSFGLSCFIFNKNEEKKDAAWEFLKWWTSTEIQTKYGMEIETLVGPSGRYNTANKEAFKNLPWSAKEQEMLMSQWENVKNNMQIPGSYYISRNINNAFRSAVYELKNPREVLNKYNKYINEEIARKSKEFDF